MPDDAVVVFLPSGRRGRFPIGMPLLEAARELGVDIDSVCGGRGICGRCQVSVAAGEFAKLGIVSAPSRLTPPSEIERRDAGGARLAPGRRLSCAARIAGDVVIDVPAESQIHRQIVRKRAEVRAVDLDPPVRLHYVELDPPRLGDQTSDLARLQAALAAEWGLRGLACDPAALPALPRALRHGAWKVTAAVRHGREIMGIWPGFRDRVYGLAVDIGTTTVAAHLCDLASGDVLASGGVMNPQVRFGEDVISRISYIQLNPGQAHRLTAVVRTAIRALAAQVAGQAGVVPADIVEATLVGNPVMIHLALGLDPTQLGQAPFPLVVDAAVTLRAGDLDLDLHPGARVYVLPAIAGHVGADAAGVLLSEAPHQSSELVLIIDVGTNAEIVLGNRDRLLACSSPTGPAFEGAQISCGQRAAPGAIERVRIDPETLVPRLKVIGCERWSDEPGFAEAVGPGGITGLCGSGIIEAVAEMFLAGILDPGGRIDGSRAGARGHVIRDGPTFAYRLVDGGRELHITQADVRAVQLAKAALYAGARILMERLGVDRVERVVLAGAFGSTIDPRHAMVLGMFPDCDLDRVAQAGNAAGTGARIALLSLASRREVEALVRGVEKVETAAEPTFRTHFVDAMAIPHRWRQFRDLKGCVGRPGPRQTAAST